MPFLDKTKYKNNVRTVVGTPQIYPDDVILLCDTTTGPVTINLLDIPNDFWNTQWQMFIVDKSGNASVNNIIINAGVSQVINASPSLTINTNNGYVNIRISGNGKYIATNSSGSGGATINGHIIQDEGVPLPQQPVLDFVGANVTATNGLGKTIVTIGGLGVTTLTNAQYLALQSSNSLTQGQFYLITDAQFTDGGVLVQAVNNNTPPSVNGIGLHLVADYQNIGNYSGVVGFGTWKDIWCLPAIPVAVGDVVIWNNLHYKNLTGVWGSAPNTDAVNWQLLPKSITNGYILECDFVRYNVDINAIIYRADKRQNEVDAYADVRGNNLLLFQWGRNKCIGNKLRGASIFFTTNSYCEIQFNSCDTSDITDTTNRVNSGKIQRNILSENSNIIINQNEGIVRGNTLSGGSTISPYGLSPLGTINIGSEVTFNALSGQSAIKYDVVGGNIVDNTLLSNSSLKSPLYSGNVNFNVLSSKGTIFGTTSISALTYCNISSFDINTDFISGNGCYLGYGKSTFPLSLDFADPSIWNLATFTLTIPPDKDYCGVFTCLNSPLGFGVKKIINLPTKHRNIFKPSQIDTLQLDFTAIGVAVADEICSNNPVFPDVLVGRLNGSDFTELEKSGNLIVSVKSVILN